MRSLFLLLSLAALSWAAADGTLLNEDFEAAADAQPQGWDFFVDEGNSAAITADPTLGRRCLQLTRSGGTVWKPMVAGQLMGQPKSCLRFEFDARIGQFTERWDDALIAWLRGDGNTALVQVALGGPGGVAVNGETGGWIALDFRLRTDSFAHVVVVTDPLSRAAEAAFDLTITQGEERLVVPNIPFRRPAGAWPANWWHSPTFHLGGGTTGVPRQAWIDNVRIGTVAGRG